jgi:hypothetical protein
MEDKSNEKVLIILCAMFYSFILIGSLFWALDGATEYKEEFNKKQQQEQVSKQTPESIFTSLKSPVILIAKDKGMVGYSIVVKDSIGTVQSFGDLTTIGNTIGASRNIGDTLK